MYDKIKLRKIATDAGRILRSNPEAYHFAKRVFDKITQGHFISLKKIVKKSSPDFFKYPDTINSKGDILIFAPRWWAIHQGWEVLLSYIFLKNGYSPYFLTCSCGMDFCDFYRIFDKPGEICPHCSRDISEFINLSRIKLLKISDFINTDNIKQIAEQSSANLNSIVSLRNFKFEDRAIGEHTWISFVRHIKKIDVTDEPTLIERYRQFVASGIMASALSKEVVKRRWKAIILCNGAFFAESILKEEAELNGIDVFTYERGLKKDCIMMSKNRNIIEFDVSKIFSARKQIDSIGKKSLSEYMNKRRFGSDYVINYWPLVNEDKAKISDELKLDKHKKIFTIFPNITWDSAVINREIMFKSMWEWLKETIAFFNSKTQYQLIVRIHPAEIRLPFHETQRIENLIRESFPILNDSIKIIKAESPASSYTLIELSDKILVYTSTLGLEAAYTGKEVITAAKTHYRNKGFTRDPDTREAYFKMIEDASVTETNEIKAKSELYAYSLFFDAQIPFPSICEEDLGNFHFKIKSLDDFFSGKFPEADFFSRFNFAMEDGIVPYNISK